MSWFCTELNVTIWTSNRQNALQSESVLKGHVWSDVSLTIVYSELPLNIAIQCLSSDAFILRCMFASEKKMNKAHIYEL